MQVFFKLMNSMKLTLYYERFWFPLLGTLQYRIPMQLMLLLCMLIMQQSLPVVAQLKRALECPHLSWRRRETTLVLQDYMQSVGHAKENKYSLMNFFEKLCHWNSIVLIVPDRAAVLFPWTAGFPGQCLLRGKKSLCCIANMTFCYLEPQCFSKASDPSLIPALL